MTGSSRPHSKAPKLSSGKRPRLRRLAKRLVWLPVLSSFSCMVDSSEGTAGEVVFSPAAVEACLQANGIEDCYGASARACREDSPGSGTPVVTLCLGEEWAYWDERLNVTYETLLATLGESDASAREDAMAVEMPEPPSQASELRGMQRAWVGFRDAVCQVERAEWAGGTGRAPAYAECMMRMTAQRVSYLEGFTRNEIAR